MKPVKTAAANMVYRGPTPEVGDLHCQRVQPGQIRSVWELDDDERRLIAEGGRIEIAIYTEPIPPISLVVLSDEMSKPVAEHPFKVEDA